MAGYFELRKAGDDRYMFNLKAGNHQVVRTASWRRRKCTDPGSTYEAGNFTCVLPGR